MNDLSMVVQAVIWKSEEPVSGYDIAKVIKSKTGNKHQQVYRELTRLAERDDVIVTHVPQEGKPDKKVYSFKTKEGFVTKSGEVSDFTKTKVSYEILIRDILDGTENHAKYIETMSKAESDFFDTGTMQYGH